MFPREAERVYVKAGRKTSKSKKTGGSREHMCGQGTTERRLGRWTANAGLIFSTVRKMGGRGPVLEAGRYLVYLKHLARGLRRESNSRNGELI